MVFRFRMVISRLMMMRYRMYFVTMAMVLWFGGSSIAFASLSTIDSGSVIASTQVFVEDCTIRTMESILLAISMTKMIDLKVLQKQIFGSENKHSWNVTIQTYRTACFWISIVSIRIRHFPAIKSSVCFMSSDGDWFDFFRFIRSMGQHNRSFGLVRFRCAVSRFGCAISGFGSAIFRFGWSIRFRFMIRGWWMIRFRFMVGRWRVVRFGFMI